MERMTWSWRSSSAWTASRSVRRSRDTCERMNCSRRGWPPAGGSAASRLSCATAMRPSFPISFFRRHIERLGLDAADVEHSLWQGSTSAAYLAAARGRVRRRRRRWRCGRRRGSIWGPTATRPLGLSVEFAPFQLYTQGWRTRHDEVPWFCELRRIRNTPCPSSSPGYEPANLPCPVSPAAMAFRSEPRERQEEEEEEEGYGCIGLARQLGCPQGSHVSMNYDEWAKTTKS